MINIFLKSERCLPYDIHFLIVVVTAVQRHAVMSHSHRPTLLDKTRRVGLGGVNWAIV